MADSVKDKQAKNSLGNKCKIASESGRQDESYESLDDLLSFDAQVFASSSADIYEVNELSESEEGTESAESQQCESDLDAISENEAKIKLVEESDWDLEEFVDADSESITPGVEQQNSDTFSALASFQDERISQLENELSYLKKISVSGFVIALLALIMSLLIGFLKLGAKIESGEQQNIVIDVDELRVDSVIDPDNQKIDDLKIEPKALGGEIKHSNKILILPEDDISGVKAADENMKQNEEVKESVGRWAVNLSSYGQRGEADKKMEELKKKGIPTEMIVVNVMGERWFRIRVTGFQTKVEAESYAATIKKTLNNGHAWVSKI